MSVPYSKTKTINGVKRTRRLQIDSPINGKITLTIWRQAYDEGSGVTERLPKIETEDARTAIGDQTVTVNGKDLSFDEVAAAVASMIDLLDP